MLETCARDSELLAPLDFLFAPCTQILFVPEESGVWFLAIVLILYL